MKQFLVTVVETRRVKVPVEATTTEEAMEKAVDALNDGEFVSEEPYRHRVKRVKEGPA